MENEESQINIQDNTENAVANASAAASSSVQQGTNHVVEQINNSSNNEEIMMQLNALPDRIAELVNESITNALKPMVTAANRAARVSKSTNSQPIPEPTIPETPPQVNEQPKRGRFAGFFDGNKW